MRTRVVGEEDRVFTESLCKEPIVDLAVSAIEEVRGAENATKGGAETIPKRPVWKIK